MERPKLQYFDITFHTSLLSMPDAPGFGIKGKAEVDIAISVDESSNEVTYAHFNYVNSVDLVYATYLSKKMAVLVISDHLDFDKDINEPFDCILIPNAKTYKPAVYCTNCTFNISTQSLTLGDYTDISKLYVQSKAKVWETDSYAYSIDESCQPRNFFQTGMDTESGDTVEGTDQFMAVVPKCDITLPFEPTRHLNNLEIQVADSQSADPWYSEHGAYSVVMFMDPQSPTGWCINLMIYQDGSYEWSEIDYDEETAQDVFRKIGSPKIKFNSPVALADYSHYENYEQLLWFKKWLSESATKQVISPNTASQGELLLMGLLKNLTSNNTYIGGKIFQPELETVRFNKATYIQASFDHCFSLREAYMPEAVQIAYSEELPLFNHCENLEKIDLGNVDQLLASIAPHSKKLTDITLRSRYIVYMDYFGAIDTSKITLHVPAGLVPDYVDYTEELGIEFKDIVAIPGSEHWEVFHYEEDENIPE